MRETSNMPTYSSTHITVLHTSLGRPWACTVQMAWPGVGGLSIADGCPPYFTPSTSPTHSKTDRLTHCPLQTPSACPPPQPRALAHIKSLCQQQKIVKRFIPRPNVPMKPSLSPPLSCGFSATCLAHTTALYFGVVVCGVDGLFSASAHKPLEGREHTTYYLFFVSSMAPGILFGT